MPLTISNTTPVRFSTSIDAGGALKLAFGDSSLSQHDESVVVRHAREIPSEPLSIPILVEDPSEAWKVSVRHKENSGASDIAWHRPSSASYCIHEWSETEGPYEVEVTAESTNSGEAKKTKKIFVTVTPEGDLPG